jgi:hypothetical protein
VQEATKLAQQINESNRKVGAVVAWYKVVASFQNLSLPDNANRGLYETLETKVHCVFRRVSFFFFSVFVYYFSLLRSDSNRCK